MAVKNAEAAAKKTAELHDQIVAAMQAPAREDWQAHWYTPEQGEAYAIEVAALEAELDQGWPGWRQKEPFHTLGHDKIAWIKVRLKRRDLIINGHGDYGVVLVARANTYPVAVPVKPSRLKPGAPVYRPVVTEAMICHELEARPAEVRAALETLPIGCRDAVGWVRDHLPRREAPSGDASPPLSRSRGAPASKGITDDEGEE